MRILSKEIFPKCNGLEISLFLLLFEDMLPAYSVCDSEGRVSRSGSLVEPKNFYRLDDAGGSAIVTISTFDLDHLEEPFKSVGIVATLLTIILACCSSPLSDCS